MRAIISFLVLTTAACDMLNGSFCENPDFEAAGIKICTDDPVDPEEVKTIVRIMEEKVREVYPQVPSDTFGDYKRNNIRVQFVNASLGRDCEELGDGVHQCESPIGGSMIQGFNIYRIYIRYHKCLASTSLDHELLHVLEYLYLDGPQGKDDHSTPFMFIQDAKEQGILIQDTIELKIYADMKPLLDSCQ